MVKSYPMSAKISRRAGDDDPNMTFRYFCRYFCSKQGDQRSAWPNVQEPSKSNPAKRRTLKGEQPVGMEAMSTLGSWKQLRNGDRWLRSGGQKAVEMVGLLPWSPSQRTSTSTVGSSAFSFEDLTLTGPRGKRYQVQHGSSRCFCHRKLAFQLKEHNVPAFLKRDRWCLGWQTTWEKF